jgi:hypothetical protein
MRKFWPMDTEGVSLGAPPLVPPKEKNWFRGCKDRCILLLRNAKVRQVSA